MKYLIILLGVALTLTGCVLVYRPEVEVEADMDSEETTTDIEAETYHGDK